MIRLLAALCAATLVGLQSFPTLGEEARRETREIPSAEVLIILVRTTLLTVNDAALTGNFSVLRERADPEFQTVASTAKLSLAFRQLILQHIDMSEAALATPKFDGNPSFSDRGLLQLKGTMEIAAGLIAFNFAFKPVAGYWQPMGITVSITPKTVVQPTPSPLQNKARKSTQPPAAKVN